MIFCQNCGAQSPDGTKFCGACGSPLASAAPQPQPVPTHEPGEYVQPDPLPTQYPQPVPQPTQYPQPVPTPQPEQYAQPVPQPTQYAQPVPQPTQYPQPVSLDKPTAYAAQPAAAPVTPVGTTSASGYRVGANNRLFKPGEFIFVRVVGMLLIVYLVAVIVLQIVATSSNDLYQIRFPSIIPALITIAFAKAIMNGSMGAAIAALVIRLMEIGVNAAAMFSTQDDIAHYKKYPVGEVFRFDNGSSHTAGEVIEQMESYVGFVQLDIALAMMMAALLIACIVIMSFGKSKSRRA